MPSTNHRSCSQSDRSRRTQTNAPITAPRSSSVPNRQFIIILTIHSDTIRRTTAFRPRIENQQIQTTISIQNNSNGHRTVTNTNNTNNTYDNHRERILNNLLRVELNEVIRNYLSRTNRSFPIHYVFDMSDIDLTTPTTTATTSHLP